MKLFAISIIILVGCLLILPGVLYLAGILMVDGKPMPPSAFVTPQQQQEIWRHIDKAGVTPMTTRLNPWEYALGIIKGKELNGARSAGFVALNYNRTHIKDSQMRYWHLSSAAMTIWVSRNWSEKEILSKVYELYSYELPYNKSFEYAPSGPDALSRAAQFNRYTP